MSPDTGEGAANARICDERKVAHPYTYAFACMTLMSAGDNSVLSFIPGAHLPDWASVKFAENAALWRVEYPLCVASQQAFCPGYRG